MIAKARRRPAGVTGRADVKTGCSIYDFAALAVFRVAVGEARIAKAGADGQHAPMLDILHERHLAQTLHHGVIVHHHHGLVSADLRNRLDAAPRQVEPAAFPVAGQVLAALGDRAVVLDLAGAADAEERRQLELGLRARLRSAPQASRPAARRRLARGFGSSSRWRQSSSFHTSACDRSGAFSGSAPPRRRGCWCRRYRPQGGRHGP